MAAVVHRQVQRHHGVGTVHVVERLRVIAGNRVNAVVPLILLARHFAEFARRGVINRKVQRVHLLASIDVLVRV